MRVTLKGDHDTTTPASCDPDGDLRFDRIFSKSRRYFEQADEGQIHWMK